MGVVLLLIGVLATTAMAQRRPPNYSQDDMPDTSFDCRDKILGGYYADLETDCQMFHVCVKVPGIGIQNYRFLCPNDTAFDQENQICADWYDVDCEAAVLYYSDNFDLYRIGYEPGGSSLPVSRPTAIPLGPSTSRPPVRPPANRNRARPTVREEEEDYFLQRSETGDRRLQQQAQPDLRSSSSGNFFTNKNEEEEEPAKPSAANKKKLAVRKFRKRPQQQNNDFSTSQGTTSVAPPSYTNSNNDDYYNNNNNNNKNNNFAGTSTYTGAPSQSTFNSPSSPSTYNSPSSASTLNNPSSPSTYNSPSPSTGFASASSSNTYNGPFASSSYNVPSTTALPPTSRNGNTYLPRYNTIQRSASPSSTTLAPYTLTNADYSSTYQAASTFNNQRNSNFNSKFAQRSTAAASYNSPSSTPATSTLYTTANNNNNNNNKRNNFVRNSSNARFSSNYKSSPASVNPTPSTVAYQTNGNDYSSSNNLAFNANSKTTVYNPSTTAATLTSNFQYNNNYQGNFGGQPSSTERAPTSLDYQTGSSEEYNNYRGDNYDYRRTTGNNGEYVDNDRNNGETLKTAPSNNYRASNLNTYQNNNYKPTTTTTTSTSKNYTVTANNVTPRSYNTGSQQANYSPNVANKFYSASTSKPFTTVSAATTSRPAPTAYQGFTASTTAQPTSLNGKGGPSPKKADAAYDYAYYDEKEPEYEITYGVSDFGTGEPQKVARSIKT